MADINNYYPSIVKEIREFKALAATENVELESICHEIENMLDNQFIETAKEYGVSRFEKIVNITPKSTDSLEERKFKVLAKYNENLPFTYKKLIEFLNILCGKEGYLLQINNNEFSLNVKVELKSRKNLMAVEETIERIVPLNMVFTVELRYNQHMTVAGFRNSFLKGKSHFSIKEEELEVG